MCAAKMGDNDCVLCLIDHGANVNQANVEVY